MWESASISELHWSKFPPSKWETEAGVFLQEQATRQGIFWQKYLIKTQTYEACKHIARIRVYMLHVFYNNIVTMTCNQWISSSILTLNFIYRKFFVYSRDFHLRILLFHDVYILLINFQIVRSVLPSFNFSYKLNKCWLVNRSTCETMVVNSSLLL